MRLRLVTLNLWNGGRLLEDALSFLKEIQADIYCLQEVYAGADEKLPARLRTTQVLQGVFPEYLHWFSPVYLDTRLEGDIEDGQLVISRWPMVVKKIVYPDIPYGRYNQDATQDFSQFPALIQYAQIQLPGKSIGLAHIHGPVNFAGLAHDQRRQAYSAALVALLKQHSFPTLVAGDSNMRPGSKMFEILEQECGLRSVFANKLLTTFNCKRKNLDLYPGYADSVVDTVLISEQWRMMYCNCPNVDISDHLPLVVDLDLPDT